MQEMNLKLIFDLLVARIKWIIASIAVGILLFASYAYFFVPEQYTSSVMLYIRNMTSDANSNSATASNLSAAEYLANTYSVVLTTDPVLGQAVVELDNAVTIKQLRGMVSSSLVDETALLKISASNQNPALAQRACDAVAKATAKYFSTVTGETSSANVIGDASEAVQTAPNVVRNAIFGALFGMILSVGIILARELLDNTIRDKTTLQMQIDVPVLGEIPSFTEAVASKGGK